VSGEKTVVERFVNVNKGHIAQDSDGDVVFLIRLQWDIDRITRDYPEVNLTATKEMMA
jgi:peptide chain release factor 3